jgi:hypothetical protein
MGWELLNGSYVFVPEKEHERERFLGKGGNTAISGTTMGYFLFRRCEADRDPALGAKGQLAAAASASEQAALRAPSSVVGKLVAAIGPIEAALAEWRLERRQVCRQDSDVDTVSHARDGMQRSTRGCVPDACS